MSDHTDGPCPCPRCTQVLRLQMAIRAYPDTPRILSAVTAVEPILAEQPYSVLFGFAAELLARAAVEYSAEDMGIILEAVFGLVMASQVATARGDHALH